MRKTRPGIRYNAARKQQVNIGHLNIGHQERQSADTLPQIEHSGEIASCWKALDRFHWITGVAFVSHGARVGVRVNDASLLNCLRDRLPPGSQIAETPVVDSLLSLAVTESKSRTNNAPHYFLYQGPCRMAHTRSADEALHVMESLMHGQVAAEAQKYLFVHAGVVAWNGRAILIPGRSFSGKSSLVAALIEAGATYLSDEYAVLDAGGQVHAYAKTLSLRDEEGHPRGCYSIEALGGQAADGPLPVGLILSATYQAGARWRPRLLTPGRALLTLLDNTVQVRKQPGMALGILQKVAADAPAFQSKRGEAAPVAAWLRERLLGE